MSATSGCTWPARATSGGHSASTADLADLLIGGIDRRHLGEGAGLTYESSGLDDMLLPPLVNFLFQRDPSCWIYEGVTLNPMTKPARRPETVLMEGDLPLASDLRPGGMASRCGMAALNRIGAGPPSRAVT